MDRPIIIECNRMLVPEDLKMEREHIKKQIEDGVVVLPAGFRLCEGMNYFVEIETLMMDGESKVWVKTITAHNVTEQTLNLILEQYMSRSTSVYQIKISKENEDEIVDNYSVL